MKKWGVLVGMMFGVLLLLSPAMGADEPSSLEKRIEEADRTKTFTAIPALVEEARQAKADDRVWFKLAVASLKGQNIPEAQEIASSALDLHPKSSRLLNVMGLIQFKQNQVVQARKCWEQALVVEPENVFAKQWLEKTKDKQPPAEGEPEYSNQGISLEIPGDKLPLEEQKKLAKKWYKDMEKASKWDLDTFIKGHRTVIARCPDLQSAEESCWRLSNLYLIALDKPDYDAAMEVLEHLLKKYPGSSLAANAKNRLLNVYETAGRMDKAVSMYEDMFQANPDLPAEDFMPYAVEYGKALEAVNRKDDAKKIYEKILELDQKKNSMPARVAQKRLAGL